MCPHLCVCVCMWKTENNVWYLVLCLPACTPPSFPSSFPPSLPPFLLPSLLPFLSCFFEIGVLTEHVAYWFSWSSRPASPRIPTASPAQHWDRSPTLALCVCFVLNRVLEIELSPYSHVASTLPTEPFHRPRVLVFKILDLRNAFTAQILYSLSINVKI